MQIPTKNLIAIIISITALIVSSYFYSGTAPFSDETIHMEQIQRFHEGNYALNEGITTLPGFHFIMAPWASENSGNSFARIRIANMLFGVITIILFAFLSIQYYKDSPYKTIQFTFLPILFPFWGLIYTDTIALLLTLLSLLLLVKKQYLLSGIIILTSLTIRQVNIVWAVFFGLLVLIDSLTDNWEKPNKKLLLVFDLLPFIFTGLAFVAFYIINDGVAVGDKWAHAGDKLFMANTYFLLFVHFICFLPTHIVNYKKIYRYIAEHKIISVFLFALFSFLAIKFNAKHPYNHIFQEIFLRNRIIELVAKNGISRIVFFMIIFYTTLSLFFIPMKEKKYLFLYVFTFLLLIPSWLVEYRYYIIPISLFILFKKENSAKLELTNSIYLVVLTSVSMYFIYNGSYFP